MLNAALLDDLSERMHSHDANDIAEILGVSVATAYRWRKTPGDIPVSSFFKLTHALGIPISANLALMKVDAATAESLRLEQEKAIASQENGFRVVTTPHFTVNCETAEFSEFMFERQYPLKQAPFSKRFLKARAERVALYRAGAYTSIEVINGYGYLDFFLRRNLFESIPDSLWNDQYNSILSICDLPSAKRYIYLRATPDLPIILSYSTGRSLVRIDDLTLQMEAEHHQELLDTLNYYRDLSSLTSNDQIKKFLSNPTNFL